MKCWLLTLLLLGPWCLSAQEAPVASPKQKSAQPMTKPQPLQTWRTKYGQIRVGSLEENRFDSRKIVIENSDGKRIAIPTADLDGESKLRWLKSSIFWEDFGRNYSIAENRQAILTRGIALFALLFFAGFFFYWLAAYVIAGSGSLFSAIRTYVLFHLATILAFGIAIGLAAAVFRYVPEERISQLLALSSFFAAGLASVSMLCRIVGKHYNVSGFAGCAVLLVWTVINAVVVGGLGLIAPWLIRQPYADDLISRYVLEPLGLI